jgi:hypothetical protein
MFIQIIPKGYFCFVSKIDSQNEFKSNVFKHVVATKRDFKLDKVHELISLVNNLEFISKKNYKIEYDGEVFEFIALNKSKLI